MNPGENGYRSERVGPRVLIIVHGFEPAGWVAEACRAVRMWVRPIIRLLAVSNVPSPPFTSLTPFARKAFHAARSEWAKKEEIRVQGVLDQMMLLLPDRVEAASVTAIKGGMVRTIIEQVTVWSADIIVMTAPAPGIRSWFWPGPLLAGLVRHANCAVLIPPPAAPRKKTAINRGA